MVTPWLRAYSTERSCSTPAPDADISSISSNVSTGSLRALGTMRGSALKTPATSVKISHTSAPSAAARATAVVSDPPRPSVVTSSELCDTPWKPATSTTFPSSSASRMRCAFTSMMRALVWPLSVTIPACEPVSEIASKPRSLMTIAARAQVTRSPVESSMSISRGCGRLETSCASATSSSVCFPRAESTATT